MSQEMWGAVDRYIVDRLVESDPALEAVQADCDAAGLPPISVTASQGKFLHLLARIQRARLILEVGTLGGYSTIWLARALPAGGRVVTLESEPRHAEVARRNLERAGVADRVEIRLGPALATLPEIADGGDGPFDLVFIDADKVITAEYFDWAVRLTRSGSVIVVDNVVRKGAVADPASTDPNVRGVRRFYDRVRAEPRVDASALQTVGGKGYDGFALIVVR